MKNKRRCVIAFLVGYCLAATLFMIMPSRSNPGSGGYDPWVDINDDGTVDLYDAIRLAGVFGTSGTPVTKASMLYDSGWIDLTGETSQNWTLTHNLNLASTGVTVDARQKTQAWNKTYGGTNTDVAWSVVQTSDGGYALAGYTNSSGAGGPDFYLVKTDAGGTMLWSKTYGGTNTDVAISLVRTSDGGGYALAGYTASFGAGAYDFYLVKTDANGVMLWSRTYGGTNDDSALSLVEASDGGYALAGYTASFGAGAYDFYLVKTEGESGLAWVPSTANKITLIKDAATPWSFVRVQIWKKR